MISTFAIVSGLFLSTIGAFVIAIPDIPQLKDWHESGRMGIALDQLELGRLHSSTTGYQEITEILDEMSDQEIADETQFLYISTPSVSLGSSTNTGFHHYLMLEDEEGETEKWEDIDFTLIRSYLERQIRLKEGRIRGLGFLIIGSGFVLQMLGVIL